MTTSFPTSKQSFPDPTGAQDLDDPAFLHSAAHTNLGDTVEELQDFVKFDGASSLDGRITAEEAARAAADSALDTRVDALEAAPSVSSLDDLSDVDTATTPPADGDRLAYDLGSGLWIPMAASAGMLALDDLTDVDLTGVADGDVLTRAGGVWTPAAPSGASTPWTQEFNESGSSFANWTAASGTWASNGTIIQQTNTGTGPFRAYHTQTANPLHPAIIEVEARIPSAGQPAGAHHAGILLGMPPSDTTGTICFRIRDDGAGGYTWEIELDSTTAITSGNTFAGAADTWIKLRVALSGSRISCFINGTHVATYAVNIPTMSVPRPGLLSRNGLVDFRNVKCWTLAMPA